MKIARLRLVPALRGRHGHALLVVLLGLLLIETLIMGSLVVATDEISSYGLRQRQLRARLAAESAVRATLAGWSTHRPDTLATGARVRVPIDVDPQAGGEIEALGGGRFLVRGFPAREVTARPRAAVAVSVLTRDSLRALFGAALRVDGDVSVTGNAKVDGAGRAMQQGAGSCQGTPIPEAQPMPGLLVSPGRGVQVDPTAVLTGAPPVGHALTGVDATMLAALARLADHELAGTVAPAPSARGGRCDREDPANWGDITGQSSCSDHMPLLFAAGDLHVTAGSGQGMLVVMGEVRVEDGVHFHGVILARRVRVGGATIVGAVRTFGEDTVTVTGSLSYDACALERALNARALARPFRSRRWWLPIR